MMIKTRGPIPSVQAVSNLKPNIMKTLMAHAGRGCLVSRTCPAQSGRWSRPWCRRPTSANIESSPMHRPSVVRTPNRN